MGAAHASDAEYARACHGTRARTDWHQLCAADCVTTAPTVRVALKETNKEASESAPLARMGARGGACRAPAPLLTFLVSTLFLLALLLPAATADHDTRLADGSPALAEPRDKALIDGQLEEARVSA